MENNQPIEEGLNDSPDIKSEIIHATLVDPELYDKFLSAEFKEKMKQAIHEGEGQETVESKDADGACRWAITRDGVELKAVLFHQVVAVPKGEPIPESDYKKFAESMNEIASQGLIEYAYLSPMQVMKMAVRSTMDRYMLFFYPFSRFPISELASKYKHPANDE